VTESLNLSSGSVVIVGASLAGLNAAEALRRAGFEGQITLLGEEPHLPYDRPPLSKQVLAGDWEPERTALSDAEELAADSIDIRLGEKASALDLVSRRLTHENGETLDFDGLVIATGARCRTLTGTENLAGVHVLRSLDDCLALRADFEASPQRVVVVGAGFIGAEVAATARGRGLQVTMVEALANPLSRVLGDEMGSVCAEMHRDHGVDLRTGVGVDAVVGTDRVQSVVLSDGSSVDADVVVVGIGVIPNTEWLQSSGLTLDDGVVCDATCSAAPGVVAAGDVARWPNELFGEMMRVEHWDNAAAQGTHAARRLLDESVEPFAPVPWFWSDQYDRKIQLAGRVRPDDEIQVVTGSLQERRFAAIYGRAGRITGVLGFNRPRHVMRYRALIAQQASFADALAAEF